MDGTALVMMVWTLFLLTGVASAFAMTVAAMCRWPAFGLGATAIIPLTAWELPVAPQVASLSGFSVYLDDVVCTAIFASFLVNAIGAGGWLAGIRLWALILAAILILSVVVGIYRFGVGAAVVEARQVIFVAAALLWALSVKWPSRAYRNAQLRKFAIFLCSALVAIGLYHAVRYGPGNADDTFVDTAGQIIQTGRILTSGQALALGLAVFALVGLSPRRQSRLVLLLVIASIVVLVLSQQRTALIALAAGALVAWLRMRPNQRVATVAGAGVCGLGFVFITMMNAGEGLASDLVTSAQSAGTYAARTNSWTALVTQAFDAGLPRVLFGDPFGAGFGRFEGEGRWVEYAPHNWYLTIFLRSGLVGLVVLAALIVTVARRILPREQPTWLVAGTVAVLVFGWGYSWPWYVLPLLALAWPSVVDERERRIDPLQVEFSAVPVSRPRSASPPVPRPRRD